MLEYRWCPLFALRQPRRTRRKSKSNLMNAAVWTKFGPPEVLQIQEVVRPAPKDNEVLIRIYATTVTSGECELRGLKMSVPLRLPIRIAIGLVRLIRRKPIILGQELAGEI